MEDEETQQHIDKATGYYLGLWNILIHEGAPESVIINQSINNMLTVLDKYMGSESKIELLEKIVESIKEEHALETEVMQ